MSKKIQLSVPKPCHEDWDAMTPVEKGKFCDSCRKQVVDFSNMSDRQVAEFFKKPSLGSVCGRFMTDQLDREIEIPRKRIPWIKYFFTIALPAFVVSVKATASRTQGKLKVNEVSADTIRPRIYDDVRVLGMVSRPQSIRPITGDSLFQPVTEPVKVKPDPVCTEPVMGKPSYEFLKGELENTVQKETLITGFVIDETGAPVVGVSVTIKGTRTGVATNEKGNFKIKAIPGSILVITGLVESREIEAGSGEIMMIRVKRIVFTGEEVVVTTVGFVSVKIVENIKEDVPKKSTTIKDVPSGSLIIYPNPVRSGTALSIEWKLTEEGYYLLQLINQSGQTVHQRKIWIDADARLLNLDMPMVPAGSYFLVLVNKKTGTKFTEKVIVQ